MRFHKRTKTLSEATGEEAIHVIFWQRIFTIFCLGLNFFPKVELEGNVVISLIEDTSRKLNIESVTWL